MKILEDKDKVFIPLDKYVDNKEAKRVMYMANSGPNNEIYLYKHVDTRHYINIDMEGNFYRYDSINDKYIKIPKVLAIGYALS